jgi:hypothetical protein
MFRRSRPRNRRQSVHEHYWKRRIAYSIVDMKPLAPPLPLNPLELLELLLPHLLHLLCGVGWYRSSSILLERDTEVNTFGIMKMDQNAKYPLSFFTRNNTIIMLLNYYYKAASKVTDRVISCYGTFA